VVLLINWIDEQIQPYCKLAIITMQMMPKISWPQRVASDASGRADAPAAIVIVGLLLRYFYAPEDAEAPGQVLERRAVLIAAGEEHLCWRPAACAGRVSS
jgi:hypothetical protein